MGKAANRRKASRRNYLKELAKRNPERFRREWSKRLESWSREIWKSSGMLTDKDGNKAPSLFEMAGNAMHELKMNGENALALEGDNTYKVLNHECLKAVSSEVDSRMYRLNLLIIPE